MVRRIMVASCAYQRRWTERRRRRGSTECQN
jgi:hypothetical protein